MSVSGLRPPRPLGSVSGLLQVASLFGLVLLLLKAAQLYLRRRWLLKAFQEFPCPPSHWLYGHSWEFQKGQELPELLKRVEKFPRASLRWLWGSKVLFMVYDPDYMKVILGRSDPKSLGTYRFLAPWIGYGLLLLNGQTWFQHRRMLTPAFHYNILKPYVGLMAESVRVMLDKWEELLSQGSHLEIFGHIFLMTLDTIMKCTFSHQGSIHTDRSTDPDGHWNHQACQLAHQHTCFVINLRKAHLQKEGELEKVRKKRHLDFLDILLTARMENGSSVSDADLHAEVDMFMFEGHDTIASGISWILYALVTHPEHQQRFREEIQSLLGDGASITPGLPRPCLPFRMGFGFRDHLDQMPDTTMCIKEALELSKPLTFPDGRSLRRVMNFITFTNQSTARTPQWRS
uniref:Uncharacterized protein n=1 Tax=Equus asinus TaxID=9793 RepID=A0A8C4PLS7_EQUAS